MEMRDEDAESESSSSVVSFESPSLFLADPVSKQEGCQSHLPTLPPKSCLVCYQVIPQLTCRLPCGHLFCLECIQEWADLKLYCPLCMQVFYQICVFEGELPTEKCSQMHVTSPKDHRTLPVQGTPLKCMPDSEAPGYLEKKQRVLQKNGADGLDLFFERYRQT